MRAFKMMALAGLAMLLGVTMAADSNVYSCPPSCDAAQGCHCASNKAPGGLSPADTPQFIVLTNDDAITIISQPIILNITERHTNKNGCKMPATWFVSIDYTDPNLVKNVFVRGHEIATHTVNHVANPNVTQIVGARDWLVKTAGIPKEKIGGFRAPYLIFSPEQRDILQKNGFVWDSSISEQFPSTTSPSAAERLWPYTMDYGLPQDCSISTGTCSKTERHTGLWEFPMWNIQDGTGATIASMDPLGDPYELYKREFDQRYNGNRAPLGIYLHAAWLIADSSRSDRLNAFLEYAMSNENVFLVTVSQVLQWIENPVPASQYQPSCPSESELLALLPKGTAICVMPNEGCAYGIFDSNECKCACQNEMINAAGYCRDAATGRCTVQKDYDFVAKTYVCPAAPAPGAAPAAAPATDAAAGTGDAAGGAAAVTPVSTGTQPMTIELDVSGTSVADFQATKAQAFCNQLLRLTGDSSATCTIVSVAATTGRRLLQDKIHVIATIQTKNADATVAALQTDTVYTLLGPSGITVVPGTVKAGLGAPVVPAPATTTTEGGADTADGSSSSTEGSSTGSSNGGSSQVTASQNSSQSSGSSGGSNVGAIVGGVVGGIAGIAIIAAVVIVVMRRRKAAAEEGVTGRIGSYNPAYQPNANTGVTATVSTNASPTKKAQLADAPITSSPLRDSMAKN